MTDMGDKKILQRGIAQASQYSTWQRGGSVPKGSILHTSNRSSTPHCTAVASTGDLAAKMQLQRHQASLPLHPFA